MNLVNDINFVECDTGNWIRDYAILYMVILSRYIPVLQFCNQQILIWCIPILISSLLTLILYLLFQIIKWLLQPPLQSFRTLIFMFLKYLQLIQNMWNLIIYLMAPQRWIADEKGIDEHVPDYLIKWRRAAVFTSCLKNRWQHLNLQVKYFN